jgi:serine/threonine-protein kinase
MEPTFRVGRYELLERIGQDIIGVLYRGHDTLLGREVAIKLMAAGFLGDTTEQARFFHEAKAAARLQHVNIVTIFEFGEHEDMPFIVTEFLRGCTLAERGQQEPAMTLHEKLDTAIQLCAGLDAAHTQGVVHRDVNPGNIWICPDGTVKLLDFGIASASPAANFADVMDIPGYLSPEQITGTEVDGRADVFSAGVVLYEMLCGRKPFEADTPTGVMLKIVHGAPDPIDDRELPAALTSAVLRAIEKSPDARYPRAGILGRELKVVKATLPAPTDPTVVIDQAVGPVEATPPDEGSFGMKGGRGLWLVVALLIVGAIVLLWRF